MKLPGGIVTSLPALISTLLSAVTAGNAAKCIPRLVRIQSTNDSGKTSELKYPGELAAPIYVLGSNKLLCSIEFSGECSGVVQSNLILLHGGALSAKTSEHFAYIPLTCTSSTCTGSFSPADHHHLLPALYSMKLALAWKTVGDASAPISHLQWPIGTVDFSGALVNESTRPGTPDQQEDVFEPEPQEIRGPAHRAARWQSSLSVSLLAAALLMVPLLTLLAVWTKLGVVSLPISNVITMTTGQRALSFLFLAWCALAVVTWLHLDIFTLLKVSTLLAPPTILCLVQILRTRISGSGGSKKKTQ